MMKRLKHKVRFFDQSMFPNSHLGQRKAIGKTILVISSKAVGSNRPTSAVEKRPIRVNHDMT